MNGKEITDEPTRLPAQQARQPQPTLNSAEPLVALQDASKMERDGGNACLDAGESAPDAALDARLTAGVVELYSALLKEPIPEKMLRLVEKLSKQERK